MTHYIGIDVHKKTSQVAVLAGDRELFLLEKSIASKPQRLRDVLEPFAGGKVLLEASTVSRWVSPFLRTLGFEVIVGDPNYMLMYASRPANCKNDKKDGRALAVACKNGHYKVVYEPTAEQQPIVELLGTRRSQVGRRTAVINRVRSLYLARGEDLGGVAAEDFRRRAKHHTLRIPAAEPLLDELAMLEDLIGASDRKVELLAQERPEVSRLMTTPGVGSITALTFAMKIGDPRRFHNAHEVESYLGLIGKVHVSAKPGEGQRISKQGSSSLRTLLVQAAWSHVGSNDPRAQPIKEWFLRLEQRKSSMKAIVGVARRLAGILWAMMRDKTVFELREAKPQLPAAQPAPARRARRYQLKTSSPRATV